MPPATASLTKPAQQARSRSTSDAIVRAGLELLREQDFERVSVATIARRAGVSIGGFYARFTGKEALVHALAIEVLDDCTNALDAALTARRIARTNAEGVVRAYVRTMIEKFREHRSTILMIMRHARAGDREHQAAVRRFNDHVHGRLRALLHERRKQITHPDPDFAVNIGLFLVSAAAREAVLGDVLRAYPVQVTDAMLVSELTTAYVAYLGVPRSPRKTPRKP